MTDYLKLAEDFEKLGRHANPEVTASKLREAAAALREADRLREALTEEAARRIEAEERLLRADTRAALEKEERENG